MSLNWNATKCGAEVIGPLADLAEVRKTQYLCFVLMLTGTPVITEKNWEEVASRVLAVEAINGAMLSKHIDETQRVDCPYTREDIRKRIGYRCNVTPRTLGQFKRWLGDFTCRKKGLEA